jgi:hypothetical protein
MDANHPVRRRLREEKKSAVRRSWVMNSYGFVVGDVLGEVLGTGVILDLLFAAPVVASMASAL